MSNLDTDEIFNSFTSERNDSEQERKRQEYEHRPNPYSNLTDEQVCRLRSNLTVLISDLDVIINQTTSSDEYDKTLDDLENDREYMCYRIGLVDEELSRRNLTDEWMKV